MFSLTFAGRCLQYRGDRPGKSQENTSNPPSFTLPSASMARPRLTSSGMLSVPCCVCAFFKYASTVLFLQLIMVITLIMDNADCVCVSGYWGNNMSYHMVWPTSLSSSKALSSIPFHSIDQLDETDVPHIPKASIDLLSAQCLVLLCNGYTVLLYNTLTVQSRSPLPDRLSLCVHQARSTR